MRANRLQPKPSGICKLTGQSGRFVKSHIIPQALTRPAQRNLPFWQIHPNTPPVKRWSSWYDSGLVVQAGEDILTAYDTWGVEALRRERLVWGGWGTQKSLGSLLHSVGDSPWGVRKIENIDGKKLRLFLLSLLWRAAATNLQEFNSVKLPDDDLETLRELICSGDPGSTVFYPIQLTQMSTIGIIHNHAPIADIKSVPILDVDPIQHVQAPIFRFYFDGLMVHFDRRKLAPEDMSAIGNMIVGQEDTFLVTTQTYEGSYQSLQVTNVQIQAPLATLQSTA
jgi:hypothetical protein